MNIDEIRKLKEMLEKEEQKALEEYKGKIIMGFKLTQCKDGRGYLQWRAYKRKDGKTHMVYIGNDPTKAEEKIKKYLEKE